MPHPTFRQRREAAGLSAENVAEWAKFRVDVGKEFEARRKRDGMRAYILERSLIALEEAVHELDGVYGKSIRPTQMAVSADRLEDDSRAGSGMLAAAATPSSRLKG